MRTLPYMPPEPDTPLRIKLLAVALTIGSAGGLFLFVCCLIGAVITVAATSGAVQ